MQNQPSLAEARCAGRGQWGPWNGVRQPWDPGAAAEPQLSEQGTWEVRPPGPAVAESEHLGIQSRDGPQSSPCPTPPHRAFRETGLERGEAQSNSEPGSPPLQLIIQGTSTSRGSWSFQINRDWLQDRQETQARRRWAPAASGGRENKSQGKGVAGENGSLT